MAYKHCYSCHVHVRGKDDCSFAVGLRLQAEEKPKARPVIGKRKYSWMVPGGEVAGEKKAEESEEDDDDEFVEVLNAELAKTTSL